MTKVSPMDYTDLLSVDPASASNPERIIDRLCETLDYHSDQYYNLDAPKISDAEYDKLMNKLIAFEAEYPQFKRQDSPTSAWR